MFLGSMQHGACTIQPTKINFSPDELAQMITRCGLNRLNQFAAFLAMMIRNSRQNPKLLSLLRSLDEILYSGLQLPRDEEQFAYANGLKLKVSLTRSFQARCLLTRSNVSRTCLATRSAVRCSCPWEVPALQRPSFVLWTPPPTLSSPLRQISQKQVTKARHLRWRSSLSCRTQGIVPTRRSVHQTDTSILVTCSWRSSRIPMSSGDGTMTGSRARTVSVVTPSRLYFVTSPYET